MGKRLRGETLAAFTMVAPAALWLFVFVAVPLIYVLCLSFCGQDEFGNAVFEFTTKNYANLFNADYLQIYLRSVLIAGATTALCVAVGYPFAYIIARTSSRHKSVFYMLVIIPFWTNSLVRVYGWKTFFSGSGWLSSVLMGLGLIDAPIDLLYTTPMTVFGMVYCLFPYMVLPLYSAIEKLDGSLIEASADLGARRSETFLRVILPLTSSGIFSGSIMVFIPCLGYFFVSDILGGGNADMIGNLIERQFQSANNWPLGAALSIMLILITIVLVRAYQRMGGDMDALGV